MPQIDNNYKGVIKEIPYDKACGIAGRLLGLKGITNSVSAMDIVHDLIAEEIPLVYVNIRNRIYGEKEYQLSTKLTGDIGNNDGFSPHSLIRETRKFCKTCHEELPMAAFTICRNKGGDVIYPHCKKCKAKINNEYWHRHKEEDWHKEQILRNRKKFKSSGLGKLRARQDAKYASDNLRDDVVRAWLKRDDIEPTEANMKKCRNRILKHRREVAIRDAKSPSKTELEYFYKLMTVKQIGALCDVSKDTAMHWFKKFGILRRPKGWSKKGRILN